MSLRPITKDTMSFSLTKDNCDILKDFSKENKIKSSKIIDMIITKMVNDSIFDNYENLEKYLSK